jgi:protein SCO1/2
MQWLLAMVLLTAPPAGALTPATLATIDSAASPAASLPTGVALRDEQGAAITLGDALGERPALLVLGYYGCSNLCSLVLQGVRGGLDAAGLHAGRDVNVVVISIAPQETPAMARAKRRDVLGDTLAPREAAGWRFLTADQRAIDAVTHALGYRYAWDEAAAQFAHPAGITIVDAQGRIHATLPGVSYAPADLRAQVSGAASAEARPHTPWLLCFALDPQTGRHTPTVLLAVRLVALAALAALLAYVALALARKTR